MFIDSSTYFRLFKEVINNTMNKQIAVAFWGQASIDLFKTSKGKIQIICNLRSGGTNPDAIDKLRKMKNIILRHNDRLHAKVIIDDVQAIVGSANISANGLGLEDNESGCLHEAGIQTRDEKEISRIRKWFIDLWSDSRVITEIDLEAAAIAWKEKRRNRISLTSEGERSFSLEELFAPDYLNRGIAFAIYRDYMSKDAQDIYRDHEESRTGKRPIMIPAYEDWESMMDYKTVIDIHYNRKGKVNCWGIYLPKQMKSFKYSDGTPICFIDCDKTYHIHNMRVKKTDYKSLAAFISDNIDAIWDDDSRDAKLINLEDVGKLSGYLE